MVNIVEQIAVEHSHKEPKTRKLRGQQDASQGIESSMAHRCQISGLNFGVRNSPECMPEIDEPVHLSIYRDDWPALFNSERSRLAMVLQLTTEPFQHIGSTAVPGLIAKPIIDIMLGVPDLALSQQYAETLLGLGYEDLGEAGVPERRYYRRRSDTNFNLHVVETNGMHWMSNIALRDLLRSDPVARARYREAKLAAVTAGANTLLAYSKLKASVIQALLIQALPKGTT